MRPQNPTKRVPTIFVHLDPICCGMGVPCVKRLQIPSRRPRILLVYIFAIEHACIFLLHLDRQPVLYHVEGMDLEELLHNVDLSPPSFVVPNTTSPLV